MNWFLSVFQEKFEYDDREAIPFLTLPQGWGTLAVVPFDSNFWIQTFFFLGFQSIVNCIVAQAAYYLVVKQQGTQSAYLCGYGIICPLLLYLPFVVIQAFDIRNMAFILSVAGATPALLFFRCIEAAHGTLPSFATRNYSGFMIYYAGTLQFRFDEKGEPVRLTKADAYQKAQRFLSVMLQTTLLYSFLIPNNYELFALESHDNSLRRLFSVQSLLNNLSMAAITSLTLEAGASGLGLITSLMTGLSTMSFSDHPLSLSESPSDFWGRRWNRIVQSGLSRGVYIPARKAGWSRLQGAILTFAVSGLLHEYMLLYMKLRGHGDKISGDYEPNYGNHMVFFLWCGIVLSLETMLHKHPIIVGLKQNLSRPLRTVLVLLTVLPIGHFFTDEYVANFFYQDIALGFPQFRILT